MQMFTDTGFTLQAYIQGKNNPEQIFDQEGGVIRKTNLFDRSQKRNQSWT